MKKTIMLLAAAAVSSLCLTGCMEEEKYLFYQQVYNLHGVRTDANKEFDKGSPLPAKGFQTELQQLFAKYPEVIKGFPADAYRAGCFFKQEGLAVASGERIADLCNHAAWFVLNGNLSDAEQKAYAFKIATLLKEFNNVEAMALLKELRKKIVPNGTIQVVRRFYDEENSEFLKEYTEVFSGKIGGKMNPRYGLSRTYYENGMMRTETYYKLGAPIGYAFTFSAEGEVTGIYYYDGKGGREMLYSR